MTVRVRFGPFTVDAETRQLLRDGSEIHLSPKAFDLLCSLIARRPKVVEKTELLEQIWPDTFVVDASLNVLIGEIRRALADDARHPRYLRTVHGVGYAFCGEALNSQEPAGPTRAIPCWLISAERTFRLAEGREHYRPGSGVRRLARFAERVAPSRATHDREPGPPRRARGSGEHQRVPSFEVRPLTSRWPCPTGMRSRLVRSN